MRALLTAIFLFSLLSIPFEPALAESEQLIDTDSVIVCPVHGSDMTPPDFAGTPCRAMSFWAVNPQGSTLWMKASLPIDDDILNKSPPLGLFLSGKAASTVWLNGHRIGSNGRPGIDLGSEIAGRMDAVFAVPRALLNKGKNDVILYLSGRHGFLHLDNPMHFIALGAYAEPEDLNLRRYWPSLITFGVLLLGALYFGVSAVRGRNRAGSVLLCLASLFAAGQLLSEVARGLFAYSYPMHDVRLVLIVLCSLGFGLSLAAHIILRFGSSHRALTFVGVASAAIIAAALVNGYDGKALVAILTPVVLCAFGMAFLASRKRPKAVSYLVALLLFGTLILLFGSEFLDVVFFYLVAGMLLFLLAQEASTLANEQQLREVLSRRAQHLQNALDQASEKVQPQQISIMSAGKIELVSTERITHCSGAGDYVELNFEDGRQVLHSGSLNDLESSLPPTFLRVHRSHIVNTTFVQSLKREASGVGQLHVSGGAIVPVSRRIMPAVRRAMGS